MTKRKSIGKDHSMIVQPAFLIGTYDENDNANFAPITWISITWDTDHYMLVISMFGTKRTKLRAAETKMVSVNLVSVDMLPLMDYFGSSSAKDGVKNKIPYGVSEGKALHIPTLDASKWVYECEVTQIVKTGDSETFFCNIVDIQADCSIDISDGINLTQFDPVIYSGHYHSIGKHLGKIGDFYVPETTRL